VATTPGPACGWRCVLGVGRSAPISAKTATAEAATSPPLTHAEATGREIRCFPGRAGRGFAAAFAESREVTERRLPTFAGTEDPRAERAWLKLAMIDSASQPGAGCMAPTSASSSPAAGRSPGCLARHFPTRRRSSRGTLSIFAGLLTSRYISATFDPVPNGP